MIITRIVGGLGKCLEQSNRVENLGRYFPSCNTYVTGIRHPSEYLEVLMTWVRLLSSLDPGVPGLRPSDGTKLGKGKEKWWTKSLVESKTAAANNGSPHIIGLIQYNLLLDHINSKVISTKEESQRPRCFPSCDSSSSLQLSRCSRRVG